MTNWNNPAEILVQYFSVEKAEHLASGIYMSVPIVHHICSALKFLLSTLSWEFVNSLHFEWRFWTREIKWKWPVTMYFLCRYTTLVYCFVYMLGNNLNGAFRCEVWVKALLAFGYISSAFSSSLVVLRTIGIWNRNKWVSTISLSLWLLFVAFGIFAVVAGPNSSPDSPYPQLQCVESNTKNNVQNYIAFVAIDTINLLLALWGIWRLRAARGGIWNLLCRQGVIWIFVAVLMYCVPLAFLILDLNIPMNLISQDPACIGLAICATRMYRELHDYDHEVLDSTVFSGTIKFMSRRFHQTTTTTMTTTQVEEISLSEMDVIDIRGDVPSSQNTYPPRNHDLTNS